MVDGVRGASDGRDRGKKSRARKGAGPLAYARGSVT